MFEPRDAVSAGNLLPALKPLLESQLGLTLREAEAPVKTLVIEHIERHGERQLLRPGRQPVSAPFARSGRSGQPMKPEYHRGMADLVRVSALLFGACLAAATAAAHHGSADYHVDREVTVTGTVTEWRWTNPHTWVYLRVTTPEGRVEAWDGEGPPLAWAAQRGWSRDTLRAGETVSLVLYPSKQAARGGLVKRIERANGEVLPVSRPWLDEER